MMEQIRKDLLQDFLWSVLCVTTHIGFLVKPLTCCSVLLTIIPVVPGIMVSLLQLQFHNGCTSYHFLEQGGRYHQFQGCFKLCCCYLKLHKNNPRLPGQPHLSQLLHESSTLPIFGTPISPLVSLDYTYVIKTPKSRLLFLPVPVYSIIQRFGEHYHSKFLMIFVPKHALLLVLYTLVSNTPIQKRSVKLHSSLPFCVRFSVC